MNTRFLLVCVCVAICIAGYFFAYEDASPPTLSGAAEQSQPKPDNRFAPPPPVSPQASNRQESAQKIQAVISPRTSFESSPDIWAFSTSRLGSKDSGELYEAYQASRECLGLLNMSSSLQNYESGVPNEVVSGSFDVARQTAIGALLKKCSGYMTHGPLASKELLEKLKNEGKTLGGPEFDQTKNPLSIDDAVTRFKILNSEIAKQGLIVTLDPLAERELKNIAGTVDNPARDEITSTSLMLAMCELGRDCGKSSYSTLLQCAVAAKCGDSLWAGWQQGMSDQNVQEVEKLTARLVAILKVK